MKSLPRRICEKLGYYGYLHIDPRDGLPFYVGKGTGNRLLSHLNEQSEAEKTRRIVELRTLGLEPQIEILKYGLTEQEAILIESSAIELLELISLAIRLRGITLQGVPATY